MKSLLSFNRTVTLCLLVSSTLLAQLTPVSAMIPLQQTRPVWMNDAVASLEKNFFTKFKDADRARLERGVKQVADFWREEDGNRDTFEQFVQENFAADQPALDELFGRLEANFEQLDGHMAEIGREFRTQSDLDRGPIRGYDDIFASYDPSAHLADDFFKNKLAFVVLLNFPLTTLDERLANDEKWSRRQWAETRLAARFSHRVPAEVNAAISDAGADCERYISEYNIWMHHLINAKGERIFPAKLRLLTHWNLRDEIKGNYSATGPEALAKQRLVQRVMERIVDQTIPQAVIDNPGADWNPVTNEVRATSLLNDNDGPAKANVTYDNSREPDTRYAKLLANFRAQRQADAYSPTAPNFIDRSFNEARELPETRVRAMLEQILSSPFAAETAALIAARLGRPLEPFDIWYNGFKPRGQYTEAELDKIVSQRYPTPEAYQKDIPNLLVHLGFTAERANYLANNIVVDPARGSGHALGAGMRSAKVHLRTRVEKSGMNYKGFNIAVHEMGHNVEQTFSLNNIDHYFLEGVPNSAFTEALAFVFQNRDLELLGLAKPDAQARSFQTLQDFWDVYEIGGVALVDLDVWHWMYDHPNATPAELRVATVDIAKRVWNKFYAPIFQQKDVTLLGIYSHMINYPLYLPDYPIGHMIAFQINQQMEKAGNIGAEFERMSLSGSVGPDLWMRKATNQDVGPGALLDATKLALQEIKRSNAAVKK